MKSTLIEETQYHQSSLSVPSYCRLVSRPCSQSLLVPSLPTGGWSAVTNLPPAHAGDTRQDSSAVQGSPKPWLELLQVLPQCYCRCHLSACRMESSKVCGQEMLWNHKLLQVLKTKIISFHGPQERPFQVCSAPVGWVRSKLRYLEQMLQTRSDWIMCTYPEGKTDNHSLWIFRYVRSCINL